MILRDESALIYQEMWLNGDRDMYLIILEQRIKVIPTNIYFPMLCLYIIKTSYSDTECNKNDRYGCHREASYLLWKSVFLKIFNHQRKRGTVAVPLVVRILKHIDFQRIYDTFFGDTYRDNFVTPGRTSKWMFYSNVQWSYKWET